MNFMCVLLTPVIPECINFRLHNILHHSRTLMVTGLVSIITITASLTAIKKPLVVVILENKNLRPWDHLEEYAHFLVFQETTSSAPLAQQIKN